MAPKYLLDLDRPLPTALHSWGNQVLSCPCGCRNAPFRKERLDRGICAVLVRGPSATITGAPNFRHLSAREVGLLCGLSPLTDCGAEPRLALALVGQLASPLQAAWVASHLARALRSIGHKGLNCPEPLVLLESQKLELLAQAELAGLRKPLLERGSWIVPEAQEGEDTNEGDLHPQLKRHKSAACEGLATPEIACTESDTGLSFQGELENFLCLFGLRLPPPRDAFCRTSFSRSLRFAFPPWSKSGVWMESCFRGTTCLQQGKLSKFGLLPHSMWSWCQFSVHCLACKRWLFHQTQYVACIAYCWPGNVGILGHG